MRVTKKDVHDLTRGILIIFGGLFLGIILHELYHSFTLQDVQSEPIAYTITIIVCVLVTIFAIKDII